MCTTFKPPLSLAATFPLDISLSTLMEGNNTILVNLVGTQGSRVTATFTVRLGMPALLQEYFTRPVFPCAGSVSPTVQPTVQPFNPDCNGAVNAASAEFTVTCTTPLGTQGISDATFSVNGDDVRAGKSCCY